MPERVRECAPSATLSSRLMRGRSFTCWKVRARPSRATCRCGMPAMSWSRKRTCPEVIGSVQVSRLNMVDLPAPLGPISPTISPAFTSKLTSFTATRPPKRLTAPFTDSTCVPRAGNWRCGSGSTGGASWREAPWAAPRRCVQRRSRPITPPRAKCSSRMNSAAKATASNWPRALREHRQHVLHPFFSTSTSAAPTSAPAGGPSPPATAISRYSMLARTSKGDGLTKRFMCA
jgi:hypothetical protein